MNCKCKLCLMYELNGEIKGAISKISKAKKLMNH